FVSSLNQFPPPMYPLSLHDALPIYPMTLCTFDSSQAVAARGSAPASKSAAAPCGRTLHLSFFFDGLTRELERDEAENRISNIGRLYKAYPDGQSDDDFTIFRAFYLSGLGADYTVKVNI